MQAFKSHRRLICYVTDTIIIKYSDFKERFRVSICE